MLRILFNSTNLKVMLHNLKLICLFISTYISNCYKCPVRLSITSGWLLYSKEGKTQEDPKSMGTYTLGM